MCCCFLLSPAQPPPPLPQQRLLLLTLLFCTLPATDVPYDLTPEFLHELFTKHRCRAVQGEALPCWLCFMRGAVCCLLSGYLHVCPRLLLACPCAS